MAFKMYPFFKMFFFIIIINFKKSFYHSSSQNVLLESHHHMFLHLWKYCLHENNFPFIAYWLKKKMKLLKQKEMEPKSLSHERISDGSSSSLSAGTSPKKMPNLEFTLGRSICWYKSKPGATKHPHSRRVQRKPVLQKINK